MQRPELQQGVLQVLPALFESMGRQLACCARRKHSLASKLVGPFPRKRVLPDQVRIALQQVELIEEGLVQNGLTLPLLEFQS